MASIIQGTTPVLDIANGLSSVHEQYFEVLARGKNLQVGCGL